MLQTNTRYSLIRKRSAAYKVHVPINARDNQYVLAEFKITPALIESLLGKDNPTESYEYFYRYISNVFFNLCREMQFNNVNFVANNKLVRVRYSEEQQIIETIKQLIIFYNPAYHTGMRSFYDADIKAKKIELLFLATGNEIRDNAAGYHQKITKLLTEFARQIGLKPVAIKIKDHQHLTYDIFSAQKGEKKTKTHGFRDMAFRYHQQSMIVPPQRGSSTFAIASLPVNMALLTHFNIDMQSDNPFKPLYTQIALLFKKQAEHLGLCQLAMIADGSVPLVRQKNSSQMQPNGELLELSFDPLQHPQQFFTQWNNNHLADTIQLLFIATEEDMHRRGYGKFVNQLVAVITTLCGDLGYQPQQDPVILRFYQHLSYNMPNQ
ncbi:DUF3083 family protein [Alteromonadaceae bacterium BrNp21-10]|nr:DUF3083 family protein [Alteromonadaceae bacterium BrNp21-10]